MTKQFYFPHLPLIQFRFMAPYSKPYPNFNRQIGHTYVPPSSHLLLTCHFMKSYPSMAQGLLMCRAIFIAVISLRKSERPYSRG